MTDDQINEAIAVSLGWKAYPYVVVNGVKYDGWYWAENDFDMDDPPPGTNAYGGYVPNYTKDLNRINDLIRSKWNILSGWSMEMRRIVCRDDADKEIGDERLPDLWFYCATAKQRCEAYLRTIVKWRDA